MRKTSSKKFWITLISVPVVGTGIILACAGGDYGPSDYGNSAFTPDAFVDSSSRPFYYTSLYKYYDIGYDQNHDDRFKYTNVDDWWAYLGNSIPYKELMYLLTNAPTSTVDSLAKWVNGKIKELPQGVKSYTKNSKTTAFINFLQLAKQAEAYAVNNLQYNWDYESKQNIKENINIDFYVKAFLQGFNNTKDAFVKQRYWFQATRAYFFNQAYQPAIDLFKKNQGLPKNIMYYRTMAYAAGAYYKLKNYSKANYYYSRVYDNCAELKPVAHYSFHPQEESDWKAALALCANNDEKATLWQMLGISYADETRSMQEIYALNPRSDKLNLLITRAINKAEETYSPWDDRFNGRARETDSAKSNELLALATRIASANNTLQPSLWQIAAGYLSMLNGDPKKAATWYAAADKTIPKNELAQKQLRLLKMVNTINAMSTIDSKQENALLADIEWLDRTNHDKPEGELRTYSAYDWVRRAMANKYKAQKDYLKAVCFYNYSTFYADDKNVEAMKTFLDKTNKTPYEQLCERLYAFKKPDLLEYQGIRAALNDNLPDAIDKLQGSGADVTLPGNPFNGRIQDCHDCDHEAPQKIKYTRLDLLKKLKDMEDKIKAGQDVYSNALLVANAFYNITHYGNARAFYECPVVGSGYYSPFSIDSVFQAPLTSMTVAAKYYTMALNAAKTNEQKARCQFMLAKCERNQWYNETVYSNTDNMYRPNPQGDFNAWNGFKALQQQYSNTQYYKEVIKECGYFRTYVNSKRPG